MQVLESLSGGTPRDATEVSSSASDEIDTDHEVVDKI